MTAFYLDLANAIRINALSEEVVVVQSALFATIIVILLLELVMHNTRFYQEVGDSVVTDRAEAQIRRWIQQQEDLKREANLPKRPRKEPTGDSSKAER